MYAIRSYYVVDAGDLAVFDEDVQRPVDAAGGVEDPASYNFV